MLKDLGLDGGSNIRYTGEHSWALRMLSTQQWTQLKLKFNKFPNNYQMVQQKTGQ